MVSFIEADCEENPFLSRVEDRNPVLFAFYAVVSFSNKILMIVLFITNVRSVLLFM